MRVPVAAHDADVPSCPGLPRRLPRGSLVQEKEAAAGQNSALQAQLRQLQEERAAELPLVAELDAERQALYAENQALNKQQAALGGEVRALKQGANALTDEASQLRYKLSQAKGQGELLRSQIVQSPHKIQALLAELAGAVERERAMVADAGGWGRAVRGSVRWGEVGSAVWWRGRQACSQRRQVGAGLECAVWVGPAGMR